MLDNVWLSRWGNAKELFWFALFSAVLVAGVSVTLVQAFTEATPVAQALVGTGAFGTTVSGAMVLRRRAAPEPVPAPEVVAPVKDPDEPKLRAALQLVGAELRSIRGALDAAKQRARYDKFSLPQVNEWTRHKDLLAASRELHEDFRQIAAAYDAAFMIANAAIKRPSQPSGHTPAEVTQLQSAISTVSRGQGAIARQLKRMET